MNFVYKCLGFQQKEEDNKYIKSFNQFGEVLVPVNSPKTIGDLDYDKLVYSGKRILEHLAIQV
jgi:hypothetical protein